MIRGSALQRAVDDHVARLLATKAEVVLETSVLAGLLVLRKTEVHRITLNGCDGRDLGCWDGYYSSIRRH